MAINRIALDTRLETLVVNSEQRDVSLDRLPVSSQSSASSGSAGSSSRTPSRNMSQRGMSAGFGFLDSSAGFGISFTLIP